MNPCDWPATFQEIFENACRRFRNGERRAAEIVSAAELGFLASIGCTAQELFDFVEDYCNDGTPSFSTALLITAVRREYFLSRNPHEPKQPLPTETLPSRKARLGGIEWLPRLYEKARRKLEGTMDTDLMYCCGGDRAFFRKHHIHAADFLSFVRDHWRDDEAVLKFVRSASAADGAVASRR